MNKIGFIGLGTMGGPMAANLVRGGHSVKGYDVNQKAVEAHLRNGGISAGSSADAASEAKVVFTMLPNSEHVESALFGSSGALAAMDNSSILIDMSTIHPFKTDEIRIKLNEHKISMIDSPVGRTSAEAAQGKSLLMVGGEKEDIEKVLPVLELLGDTIIECGGPGTGIRMKIVNNYMTTSLNVLTAESLTLAQSIGLDETVCMNVLSGTPAGRGHLSTTYPAKVLKGDITPAFMVDLAFKDLVIGLDLAEKVGSPAGVGIAAKDAYSVARDQGRGSQDWTAILLSLKSRAELS